MTDTPTGDSGELDSSTDDSPAPDGTKEKEEATKVDKVDRSELEAAIKRRDSLAKKARESEERAKALEQQISTANERLKKLEELERKLEDDEAQRQGNIEKLRKSAADRETELLAENQKVRTELQEMLAKKDAEIVTLRDKYLLQAEVMRVLGEVTTDAEVSWLLVKDHMELAEDDDGQLKPRVKDSTLDVKTFVERHFEERGKDYLLRNKRKQGTGAQQSGETNGKHVSLDQISKSPDRGRELFTKNPDAALEYLRSAKLTG